MLLLSSTPLPLLLLPVPVVVHVVVGSTLVVVVMLQDNANDWAFLAQASCLTKEEKAWRRAVAIVATASKGSADLSTHLKYPKTQNTPQPPISRRPLRCEGLRVASHSLRQGPKLWVAGTLGTLGVLRTGPSQFRRQRAAGAHPLSLLVWDRILECLF